MKESIFDYRNYKNYLHEKITQMPSKGRGVRLNLAKYLGCQTAYVSQVLNQETHFSLEQAVKVSNFFKLNREEGKYFLLLVQHNRAGSHDLRTFLEREMDEILEKRKDLSKRLNIKDALNDSNQHIYYSAWYYAAVHILLSIPEYQRPIAISKHLSLPIELIHEVIDFLCSTGLAVQKGNRYIIGTTRIHLSQDSIQIRRHHSNWRNQAQNSIDRNLKEDLHYSNILSMSEEDIPKVKEILIKSIEECREIIKVSNEEKLQILTMDFFAR